MAGVPNTYGLPTTEELGPVLQEWAPDPARYIGASILREQGIKSMEHQYERDLATGGMTAPTTLDSDPRYIVEGDYEKFRATTLFFKEARRWNESDLLVIRQRNVLDQRAGRDLIVRGMANLNRRLEVRKEWLRWQTLQGSVSINDNGVVHSETWSVQTFTPDVLWTDTGAADPVADAAAIGALYTGKGATAVGARAYMNRATANLLLNNVGLRNFLANDRQAGRLITATTLTDLFTNIGGIIPTIYDEGYLDESKTYVPFIPDNKVVVIGTPTMGEELGFIATTPSLFNGGIDNPQPGKFVVVRDDTQTEFNPKYEVMVGQYLGPVLYHPEYIVVVTVG